MYSRDDAKARGSKLRGILNDLGYTISHTHSLETIARMEGFRDWNTCVAALDQKGRLLPIPKGWQAGGDQLQDYDIGMDPSLKHNELHTAVIRYRENTLSKTLGFGTMMQSIDAKGYKGKRLQFSSSLKSENCDGAVTIWLRADSNNREGIAFDNLEGAGIGNPNGPIADTTDWTTRTIVLEIPNEAEKLSFGFYVRGKGAGYASGFSMDIVSDEAPVTIGTHGGVTHPVNLALASS